MKKAYMTAIALAASAAMAQAFEVEQIFREERFTRGNVNLRALQPIDRADWIGPKGGAKGPCPFVRFRRPFKGRATPLTIDVSADARFVLLLDGKEFYRGSGFINLEELEKKMGV